MSVCSSGAVVSTPCAMSLSDCISASVLASLAGSWPALCLSFALQLSTARSAHIMAAEAVRYMTLLPAGCRRVCSAYARLISSDLACVKLTVMPASTVHGACDTSMSHAAGCDCMVQGNVQHAAVRL